MSTVSIVLCTYNGQRFLQAQVASLLKQERLPDEIVIGDDASSDSTLEILGRELAQAEAMGVSIKLISRATNVGIVENFSDTLAQAKGDVIFLCDQDDIWHPKKIATIVEKFSSNPELMLVSSDARLVDDEGDLLGRSLFEVLALKGWEVSSLLSRRGFDVLLRRSIVTGATAAFSRKLLKIGLPVGGGWLHDEWLAIMASISGQVQMLDVALIDYRQHDKNQVGMQIRSMADKWKGLVRPRAVQFDKELQRIDALQKHLRMLADELPLNIFSAMAERRRHFERRIAISKMRGWARVLAILHEFMAGGYARHATGLVSAIRDLFRHG